MFADKSLKSNEGAKKMDTGNKNLQRKAHSMKLTQRAVAAPNTLLTGGVAQFKKMVGNQALVNLSNVDPLQRVTNPNEEEESLQMKKENNTGMPDQLKAGVESLSGIDMSEVKVHYNSNKPAKVGALAYTQGRDIHVASGQERHLAHEAWHVVQQAQGRVQPTTQLKDVAVNDNPELEHEADVMGKKALSI